ncbi:ATP-binding cassette domain-containing protein [Treponema phagedenis]|uniref:ABC transporter ATP-binding protein n=1 Tax=Treponema phagedenis TaxID=162 RepID=A0A0B7GWJ2_TREPH|nr:ABC transporter ATP-binding protein [Treponema phagedenis]NVP24040.1 ABC transporter ATP-binding protein [Treponema phagedenis]QEJ96186.1 ABC transporter ATP-binding protein [Treponema phagedenis]QEJ99390.1 ABC transporter ATP-binding protein [Treponema phagedenis]QEJ99887.1 ABC transporter ATP-binding protein [Treponema phagedenis]QEK04961.1 ABC transporter ATP-binding protein [Treponema phagedenis]
MVEKDKAEKIVEIRNVSFQYENGVQDAAVINNVSLQVERGECILLTGISGCGKTTILRLMNGLIPHYHAGSFSGEIKICGENVSDKPIYEISKKASTVLQNPKSQFFNLDTTSEIVFFLENMGTPFEKMHERLTEVSNFLGIKHLLDRSIFQLSGGEKQMIAIASALASDTDILLFDEPTSNLDVSYIEKIAAVLKRLKEAGKTLIISEHRLYFLKDVIDRALIIKDGKIAQTFSANEFSSLTEDERKQLLLRPINFESNVFCKPKNHKTETFENGSDEGSEKNLNDKNTELCTELYIKNLRYRFPKEKINTIEIENLKLEFGKVIALAGKSGQGKTTFAHCLAGLTKGNKDAVFFSDKTCTSKTSESKKLSSKKLSAKKRLTFSYIVMQDVGYQLFTESVADELELGKNKTDSSIDIEQILSALCLTELKDRHPLSLSGGQKQRVSIGAAVSSGARILIFDEPTSGMDYFHMKETAELINSIRSPEKLILIISHDFEFLSLVADELLLMEDGKIISQNPFTESEAEKTFEYLKA